MFVGTVGTLPISDMVQYLEPITVCKRRLCTMLHLYHALAGCPDGIHSTAVELYIGSC